MSSFYSQPFGTTWGFDWFGGMTEALKRAAERAARLAALNAAGRDDLAEAKVPRTGSWASWFMGNEWDRVGLIYGSLPKKSLSNLSPLVIFMIMILHLRETYWHRMEPTQVTRIFVGMGQDIKKHAVSQSRHNCCRRNEENEDKGRSKKKSKKAPPEAGLIEKFVSSMPYPRPITCWGTTHLMASTE